MVTKSNFLYLTNPIVFEGDDLSRNFRFLPTSDPELTVDVATERVNRSVF